MWKLTEVADWIDGQAKVSTDIVDRMVEESHYSTPMMIMASTDKAFMSFGTSMSDLLRLGDGVATGTLRGVGSDLTRFVAIFPIGKAAKLLQSARGTNAARAIIDPLRFEGICSWVTSARALRQTGFPTGGKMFAEVEQLMKAAGHSGLSAFKGYTGISLAAMVENLKAIGAKVGPVVPVNGIQDLFNKQILRTDGSVVIISLRAMLKSGGESGHQVYAYYDNFRRLRFMDRTITETGKKCYASIEEIAAAYPSVQSFTPRAAAQIENMYTKINTYGVPTLVMPIKGIMAEYLGDSKAAR